MDRQEEAVDVYSILKPVFFIPKVLGLSPYNAVGDIGDHRIIVTVSAAIYSIGMIVLNVGVIVAGVLTAMFTWKNICTSTESVIALQTVCLALCAYFTCVFGCRQTARQFTRLNDLIGKTCYSAWRRDLQLLLAMQILCVIMTAIIAVLDIIQIIRDFYDFRTILFCMMYYLSELAGFMSEHQFAAFMHVLKRTVQNCNNHIDALCENDDVINCPLYRNFMNGQKSVLFVASNNSGTSKRVKIHSQLMDFKQLREKHASACDTAESVNAVYSPVLLLSVARSFTSLSHILYYIIINVIVQERSFFCKIRANTTYFVWLIYCSLRLIWLVYFTAFAAKEVSHKV